MTNHATKVASTKAVHMTMAPRSDSPQRMRKTMPVGQKTWSVPDFPDFRDIAANGLPVAESRGAR